MLVDQKIVREVEFVVRLSNRYIGVWRAKEVESLGVRHFQLRWLWHLSSSHLEATEAVDGVEVDPEGCLRSQGMPKIPRDALDPRGCLKRQSG